MPLPIDITVENASSTVASTGQVPIETAVQWSNPEEVDWALREGQSGSLYSSVLDFYTPCILNLGAGGNWPAYLGSMATQTTRRVHIEGVPLTAAQRLTGTLESGDLSPTVFATSGDGLALFGGVYPSVDFYNDASTTNVAPTRFQTRDFNPLCETVELDGRNQTFGVYHQWRCQLYPGKKRVKWTLTLTFSDERYTTDRAITWPKVRIKVPLSWELHVETSVRCPGSQLYTFGAFKYWEVVPEHTIFDGQTARFRGTFMLPNPTATELGEWQAMPGNRVDVPRAICDPEEFRGKLYFLGGLPITPSSFDAASRRARYDVFRNFNNIRPGPPNDYTRTVGDLESKARTRDGGAQPDFAATPFYHSFFGSGGNPLMLCEYDTAGLRHISRPIIHRRRGLDEVNPLNARLMRWGDYAPADFWTNGQMFHVAGLKDRFPETDPRGKPTTGLNQYSRPFRGMDGYFRAHSSWVHAIDAWFLGGCFDAEDIVRAHIENFLHEWPSTNAAGGHRSAGEARFARLLDMACWMWFLTGDSRIVDRLNELQAIAAVVFPNMTAGIIAGHEWKRIGAFNGTQTTVDLGSLGGSRTMSGAAVDPWQTRLCVGYYRAWQVTGSTVWKLVIEELTKSWIKLWRRGRFRQLRRGQWQWVGPKWHEFFKILMPGLQQNPGTLGALPTADYISEANEHITWKAFDDEDWAPHMLAIAMALHANDAEVYGRAREIWEQTYGAWSRLTNVDIFNKQGEWMGDDALIPDGDLDISFVAERIEVIEPPFEFEGGDLLLEFTAETSTVSEPGFTLELGPIVIDVSEDDEFIQVQEPGFSVEQGAIEVIATSEVSRVSEPGFDLDIGVDLTFAAEVVEVSEPAFVVYGGGTEIVVSPDVIEVIEPGFVYDDGSQTRRNQVIAGNSGPPRAIKGLSGAPKAIKGTVG